MQVLSKGWKLPETGDFGDVWFPALEDNINQLNTHDHDGTDSEKIAAINLVNTGSTQSILVGSFADQGDGYWRATVTVPNSLAVDNFCVTFRDPTTKEVFYLKTLKLSSTQYYVYMNIAQTIEAVYGV